MTTEGDGKGAGAAIVRLGHMVNNTSTALKWNFIEFVTSHKPFGPEKIPKRSGDVAVITGGARGIGADVVKKLLQADMQVFIGCRNIENGNSLIKKLRDNGVISGQAECIPLDLTTLESVRKFAKAVLDKNLPIHLLINNAGIMWVPFELTPDGLESQFHVNYLSHFLLTNLLLPRLANSGREGIPSRIINVTSIAQYGGNIQFDNLQMKKNYSMARAYQNSKLMQVLSTNYLNEKFRSNNVKVAVFAVHPGIIESDLYNVVFGFSMFRGLFRRLWKSPNEGADGIAYAALSTELNDKGGLLLGNSQEMPQAAQALNTGTQQQLWDVSCELVGINKSQLNTYLMTDFKQ